MSVLKNQALSFYNKNKKGGGIYFKFNNLVDIDKSKNNKYLPLIVYFHLIEDIGIINLENFFHNFLKYEHKLKTLRFYKNKPYYDDKEITFIELGEKLDAVEGEINFNSNKKEREENLLFLSTDKESKKDIVFQNQRYTVYLADSKQKCIKYSKGYGFCIGYKDYGNMFNTYRYRMGYTHYFIFDNNPNNKSEKIVVVQVSNENEPKLTDGRNNTGYKQFFNTYLQENPDLKKDIFKPIDLSNNEKAFYNKYSCGDKVTLTNEEFDSLSEIEFQYVFDFNSIFILTADQFSKLSSSLRGEYINRYYPIGNDLYELFNDNEKILLNNTIERLIKYSRYDFIFNKYCDNVLLNNSKIMNNEKDSVGHTPLYMAIHNNRTELIELIIDKYNCKNDTLNKYLIEVIHLSDLDIVKKLIEKTSNLDFQDKKGDTALHYSTLFNNNLELVKLLIHSGADVNIKNKDNYTPLYYSISNNDLELVNLLIDNGAEIDEESFKLLNKYESIIDIIKKSKSLI